MKLRGVMSFEVEGYTGELSVDVVANRIAARFELSPGCRVVVDAIEAERIPVESLSEREPVSVVLGAARIRGRIFGPSR